MRYYIIGDTGGHLQKLKTGLEGIGVDTTNHLIPKDATIIHLGDLIHKGPSSAYVSLRFVQKMQAANPGRWIQLVGNHELQHVIGAYKFWSCDCSPDAVDLLQEMFYSGAIMPAYAATITNPANLSVSQKEAWATTNTKWIFTHAGITKIWWEHVLNSETNVHKLAKAINAHNVRQLTSPGSRLGYPKNPASPVWASAPDEVAPDWMDSALTPFNQAAGHTYLYAWEHGRWFKKPSKQLRAQTLMNPDLRTTLTRTGPGTLLVIADPGFELTEPKIEAQPVIFLGETP